MNIVRKTSLLNDEKKSPNFWTDMSWRDKYVRIRDNVTVEPLLMFFIIPSMLTNLATQNLYLEKACRVSLAFNNTVCDALTARQTANYTQQEEQVQTLVAEISGYRSAIQSALPCLLIMFWGSWSDRHRRRKPCMLIPLIGEMMSAMGLIAASYFSQWSLAVTVFLEVIFPAIAGGWFTMFMGMYSYMADITTEADRTFRIGVLTMCLQVALPIGLSVSGILLKQIGFYGVYSTSLTLQLCAFVYGVFYVRESPIPPPAAKPGAVKKSFLADFFDLSHINDTMRVTFKQGKQNRRAKVIVLMMGVMIVSGPWYGEQAVVYLFSRLRFNWSEIEFSIFSTFAMTVNTIGFGISVGILSGHFKMDDALIGIISSTSKILASLVYGFAVYSWQMYAGSMVDILNGTSFIAMRSIASKLVSSDELGKVNSMLGVTESIVPLVYAPLYARFYMLTLTVLPGTFYLIGGAMTIPALGIFAWLWRQSIMDAQQKSIENGRDHKIGIVNLGADLNDTPTNGDRAKAKALEAAYVTNTKC